MLCGLKTFWTLPIRKNRSNEEQVAVCRFDDQLPLLYHTFSYIRSKNNSISYQCCENESCQVQQLKLAAFLRKKRGFVKVMFTYLFPCWYIAVAILTFISHFCSVSHIHTQFRMKAFLSFGSVYHPYTVTSLYFYGYKSNMTLFK